MSGKGGRKETRREALSGEDRALWGEVTKSIAPLRARAAPPEPINAVEQAPRAPRGRRHRARPRSEIWAESARARNHRPAHQAAALARHDGDRRAPRSAWHNPGRDPHAAESFLRSAQDHGHGLVLVITGKGRPSRDSYGEEERGVLAASSAEWLSLPDLRPLVVGFSEAAIGHGGTGAL